MAAIPFILASQWVLAVGQSKILDIQLPHAETPASLSSPFWLIGNTSPVFASYFDVCAVVERVGEAKKVKRFVKNDRGHEVNVDLIEFDVRAVDAVGMRTGIVQHCYSGSVVEVKNLRSESAKFLLLGWSNGNEQRLDLGNTLMLEAGAQKHASIGADKDSLFVAALMPTQQNRVDQSPSNAGRAYLNLAQCALSGIEVEAMRRITFLLAAIEPGGMVKIEDVSTYDWLASHLGPLFRDAPKQNGAEKLRFEGLAASWLAPKGTMDYLRVLPGLLTASRMADALAGVSGPRRDSGFVGQLNLCKGLNPDVLAAMSFEIPQLSFLAFDPHMGKPSRASQARLLCYLDDPEIYMRAHAFSVFANWHGKFDWALNSNPTYSPTKNGMYIPNEKEMRTYWLKEFADLIKDARPSSVSKTAK